MDPSWVIWSIGEPFTSSTTKHGYGAGVLAGRSL
jgi:hypothetical protein